MNFERKLIWKVYQEDGTFIETLDDVTSDLKITKQTNGGDSDFRFSLDRKMDDFDEDTSVKFNNRIKVYLQDSDNLDGTTLVAYGYIVSYSPYLRGKEEGVEVTCLSAISKLSNDFYRLGVTSTSSDLGVDLSSKRTDEMMEDIITHYRSTETNSMISSDYSNADSTTDNAGGAISFNHRFFNMRHIDAIREASKFLAKNKPDGHYWYWRIDTEGKLWVKKIAQTADHSFQIGKHIVDITGEKSITDVKNKVYFWNEKSDINPDYIRKSFTDTSSETLYDTMADYITDSKITYANAADLTCLSRVYENKDPQVKINVTLNGDYDLASIRPGQTCKILNLKNNPYKIGSDDILFINKVDYMVDSAVLELSEPRVDFSDIVESERQRLDKEMRWFGKITQDLTASQLAPTNRNWNTSIRFSATSGSDAYRKVDWTTGEIYLPDGAKRIIDAGTTGNMISATDYFIYLDEDTLPTTSTASDSGTGIVREGGTFLVDSGKSWSTDQYEGYVVEINSQKKIIKSNTDTVLNIEDRWTISDQTSAYTIKKHELQTSSSSTPLTDTRIVFTNVKAHTSTASEAVIVPQGGTNSGTVLDGETQISKHSIDADRIKANVITTSELNFTPLYSTSGTGNIIATINATSEGGLTIEADNLTIASTTTFTSGWDSASNVGSLAVKDTAGASDLDSTVISGGKIITGLLTADNIQAGTLTGRTVQTASSGIRTVLDGADDKIKFMKDSTVYGYMLPWTDGVASPNTTTRITESSANDKSQIFIGEVGSGTKGYISLLTYGTYSTSIASTSIDGYIDISGQKLWIWCETAISGLVGVTGNITSTAAITAAGTGTGTSSSIKGYNMCTTNGTLYYNADLVLDIYAAETRSVKHWYPSTAGDKNLGNSTYYWNEVNYKTLEDRGCLGWFDGGVELQDGSIVSDTEALKSIQKHPTLLTTKGIPRLDYKTMPKVVYSPASDNDGNILPRDIETDKPYTYETDKKGNEKKVYAEDSAELSSLVSIMVGAIKELDSRLEKLEK